MSRHPTTTDKPTQKPASQCNSTTSLFSTFQHSDQRQNLIAKLPNASARPIWHPYARKRHNRDMLYDAKPQDTTNTPNHKPNILLSKQRIPRRRQPNSTQNWPPLPNHGGNPTNQNDPYNRRHITSLKQ